MEQFKVVPADTEPEVMTAARACGDCRACCTVLGVVELAKEQHRRCHHVGPGGCAIYETRPGSCAGYVCGWLGGAYGKGQSSRPDRLGVIVDKPLPSEPRVLVREVWRGAFDRRGVRALLLELHASGLRVVLMPFAGRKLPTGKPLEAR